MTDTACLRRAVEHFMWESHPSSSNGSDPVTVRDINNLINETGKVLNQIIDALEDRESR